MKTTYATRPGSAEKPNEDWISVTDNVIVVLDGVTAPRVSSSGCRHSVTWFTANLGATIAHLAESNMSLRDVLRKAINNTNAQHKATCNLYAAATPAAAVAVVRKIGSYIEYLVLADTTIAVDTKYGIKVFSDDRVDKVTGGSDRVKGLAIGTPEHKATVDKLSADQLERRNVRGGYWVASTDPEAAHQATFGRVSAGDVTRIAVMTDGVSRIVDTFGFLSWYEAMDYLYEQGPDALIDYVRTLEDTDYDGHQWPRFKRSDDATVAYITVDGSNP